MTDPFPSANCPDCGATLPPGSPQALCPACLMRQALASRTLVNGDTKTSSAPPPSPEEIAGKFPQFEILECLGRGGMGVVYKARQKSLNRLVAIKILAPERGSESRFAERFAREAELLAKLNHPHIVTIHDFGETGGLFYLVMEFVDGVNLRDLLRDGKLEAKQALAIVPPICDALQYAHDKGIVHRDIKPENLLLDRDGRIKIADFGIAALMGTNGDPSGTPPYMAPEQCGASPEVDNRADIYALGVVLYEMLTGERPNKELIAPSKKVQIDVRLDEIVLRALEKTPELRYQTAGEFRTVLETVVQPPQPPNGSHHSALIKSDRGRLTWQDSPSSPMSSPSSGTIELFTDKLVVSSGTVRKEIPLASIRTLQEAVPPVWWSPGGHRYLAVEYDAGTGLKRIAFQAGATVLRFVGDTKLSMAEWLSAIQRAVKSTTGREIEASPGIMRLPLAVTPVAFLWLLLLVPICVPLLGGIASAFRISITESLLASLSVMLLPLLILSGVLIVRAASMHRCVIPKTHVENSRFSRTALVGAFWAFLSLLHFIFPTLGYRMKSEFVPIMMSVIALSAPFGVTILGWLAVRQIRRSAGKLQGLGLAIFDGLFFPLLLPVVAVAFAIGLLISELEMGSPSAVQAYALALVVCAPLLWVVIRRVWRRVNPPPTSTPGSSQGTEKPKAETSQSRLTSAATGESHFSRTAIVGVCWMAFFVLAFVPWMTWVLTYRKEDHREPPLVLLSWVLPSFLVIIGTFGTTILGWVAVAQIRRSAGKLRGLWLAVFDGLIFPLLVAAAACAVGFVFLQQAFNEMLKSLTGRNPHIGFGAPIFFTVSLLILTPIVFRLVWRKVNAGGSGRASAPSESPANPESQSRLTSAATAGKSSTLGKCAVGLFIGAVVGFPLLWSFMGAQEVIVLCGLTLLLSLVLGLMSWRSQSGKFAALASGLGLLLLVVFTVTYITPRYPARGRSLSFSPEVSLTLTSNSTGANRFIDFDTGKVLSLPPEIASKLGDDSHLWALSKLPPESKTPSDYLDWIERNGVDAVVMPHGLTVFKKSCSVGHGNSTTAWGSRLMDWNAIEAAEVQKAADKIEREYDRFNRGGGPGGDVDYTFDGLTISLPGPGSRVSIVTGGRIWIFKTRGGKAGALLLDEQARMTGPKFICYKLVQGAETKSAGDQPSTSKAAIEPNRVLFTFSHDRNRKPMIGHRIALPIHPEGDTGWQPANGQAMRLEDGRTVLFKMRVAQSKAEGIVGKVATKTDYEPEWRELQQHLRSSGPSTLTFANGLQVSMSADHSDEHANPNSIALVPVPDQSLDRNYPVDAVIRTPAIGIGALLMVSLALGVMSWRTRVGKFAALASGLGLLLCVAFAYNSRPPRKIYGGGRITAYTQVKDNLYAAMSAHYGTKESRFELGKPIDLDLLFQNYSSIDIVVNPPELPLTAWLTVTDSNGTRVELTGQNEAALVLKEPRVLKTGQGGAGGYAMSLLLLPKNDTSTAPKAKADAMAWVEPGTYNLQFHLRLPPTSSKPDGSSPIVYRTVPLTIEVAGPPTTDQTTKQLEPPDLSFGPVMERELRVDEETVFQGLDFETGTVLTLSREEFDRIDDDRRDLGGGFARWVQANSVDLFALTDPKTLGMGGSATHFTATGFKLSSVPLEAWDDISDEVLKLAAAEGDEFWESLDYPANATRPHTYAMRSGDKLGLLQITARLQNPDGIKLRYKLVQQGFIDQVVPNVYARGLEGVKCFDFESNRFHTPPEALADELLGAVNRAQSGPPMPWYRVSPVLIGWLDQTGVDVVAASYDSGAQLLSLTSGRAGDEVRPQKGALMETDPSQFPTGSAKLRIPQDALTLARIAYLNWPRQPKSWFYGFITREGNRGDLQITGITDDKLRDVKIRYKLVQDPAPVKPAQQPEYEISVQFGSEADAPVVKADVQLGTPFSHFLNAGERLLSISGQIDPPKNGKFPGTVIAGDWNLSEKYKGSGQQGGIPVELELGKPFSHTVFMSIARTCIITLNKKPAATAQPSLPETSGTDAAEGSWGKHFQHGEIRRAQNGLEDALASYRLSLAAAQAEMKQRPQDAAWQAYGQRRIKKSLTRIGDVLCAQGDLAGALENYRAAKESFEPLVRKEPADEEQRNELIALYVKIGDVLQAQGDQAAALATYRKAQEFDFPDFETWEEHFKSLGGNYYPTQPFDPEELRQLAAKPLNEDYNSDLAELICRAGAEKDAGFRYLLEKPELRKDEDVNLALIAYDYSINGNAKALDDLLARLAKERRGSDSSVAATLAFVDEWDRVPKAMKAHFVGADGAGGDLKGLCEAWTAYHFPRNSLQYEGKAGEGAPVKLLDRIASFPPGFGPVVERLVPRLGVGKACLLNFENGGFRTPPDNLAEKMKRNDTEKTELTKSSLRWLRESGVDIAASPDSDTLWFLGVIAIKPQHNGDRSHGLEDLTPEIVIDVLSGPWIEPERKPGIYSAIVPAGHGAMVFITSTGNMGVLEIPDGTNNPDGVKIRYKLLRGVTPSAEAMTAAKVAWDLPPIEPVKELNIPQQEFPEGAGRMGYRLTVKPGEWDYVLASVREYEGSDTVGEKTPVKRQAARLMRTPGVTHSEDIFLDSHRVARPIRKGEADRFVVSGFGQQVAITDVEYAGGFGVAGSFGISGQDLSSGLTTRRFRFTDTGGDKARTRIVEFELQVIDAEEAAALAKRHGISLPDENVANWAITLAAPLAEPAAAGTDAGDGSWGDHYKQGEIRRAQGELADALASYRRSLAAAQAEIKQRPQGSAGPAYLQRHLAKSLTRIGDVLCAQGDLAGALENYRAGLAALEPLVRKVPADKEQRNELAALHVKIGDVLQAQGDQAGALATYRKAQEVNFPDSKTWEETFKTIGCSDYNPTEPFKPEELRQLANNPKSGDDFRRLMWLINRAGAEKDAGFRDLLQKPELRKNKEVDLALIAYDYSVNGNPKALDELLTKLAKEKVGSDSSVVLAMSFIDEWDRIPKAASAHFAETDGAGGVSQVLFKLCRDYLFPRHSLQYEGKAGEGAPLKATTAKPVPADTSQWQQLIEKADALKARSDLPGALKIYREALGVAEKAAGGKPDDAELQADLVTTHLVLGRVNLAAGNFEDAAASFRACRVICEKLIELQPKLARWPYALALAHRGLGDVLDEQGKTKESLEEYRHAKHIIQQVADQKPDQEVQNELATIHFNLGRGQLSEQDWAGALDSFSASLAITESLAQQAPDDATWQGKISVVKTYLGQVCQGRGELDRALRHFQEALGVSEKLALQSPGDVDCQQKLAFTCWSIGDVLLDQDDLDGALKWNERSIAIIKKLTALDPGNIGWQGDLLAAHQNMGHAQNRKGDLAEALTSFQQSIEACGKILARHPDNLSRRYLLSVLHLRAGKVQQAQGALPGALGSFRSSLGIAEELLEGKPRSAQLSALMAVSSWHTGQVLAQVEPQSKAEAQAMIKRALGTIQDLKPNMPKLDETVRKWIEEIEVDPRAGDR